MVDESNKTFSLESFELLSYTRNLEFAAREFIKLLRSLDEKFGCFDVTAQLNAPNEDCAQQELIARITSALSCLFSDPKFELSADGWAQIMPWQRWVSALFSASWLGNADHILRALNVRQDEDGLELTPSGLLKFCVLYTPDSEIPVDLDGLWAANRRLAAALFFVLLSPRFLGSTAAHNKRETLLKWLPEKLKELETLDLMPTGILHDVYMHCSYADLPSKHDIKTPLNELFKRTLTDQGIDDIDLSGQTSISLENGKPILLVVLEYLSANHSIYRTHSTTLRAARDKFHIIGMGVSEHVDEKGREIFHEFIELNGSLTDMLKQIRAVADERSPAALYMPSVGMFQLTMFLATLRLAPLQLMALGHPATTHSKNMDYVVVEEDYIGDPDCFSEKLMILPKDGLPYVPSGAAQKIKPVFNEKPSVVKIAVCATVMKLNPNFLWTLANITRASKKRVEFHFLVGFSHGLTAMHVRKIVRNYLGDFARIYNHQSYPEYMEVIRHCDLFLNPFPFGNTNGIVDTVSAGLIGVCRTGREVHEHIDEGLFRRLGLPDWTITKTNEDYIAAAVRLIDNEKERIDLRKNLIARDGIETLFTGRPQIFGEKLLDLVESNPSRKEKWACLDKAESAV